MNYPPSKNEVLDREYLVMRAKVLELAAALDRIDRASGELASQEQRELVRQACEVLLREPTAEDDPSRAEQVQLLFSRAYSENWRDEFKL